MIRKLSTGVPGLDRITYGGIPEGRTTLIAGKSGTSKSVLAMQLASNLARAGHKTQLLAVEEEPADLLETGDSLGLGVTELVNAKQLSVLDVRRPRERTVVTGDYDAVGLIHRIEAAAKDGVTCFVLDSATALFSPKPPEDSLRAMFFDIVEALRRNEVTAVITAEAPDDYGPRTTLGVEDYVCDMVIVLRNHVDAERRRRTIEVHKYRRSPHQKGEYPFTITDAGVVVFPFTHPNDRAVSETARFSSGFEGLDRMMNGGWLRDSITIVRGPAGCGKTTLAGMYARAGSSRNERVAYYGFEEPRPMLLRNFGTVGLPVEELIASGCLLVECRYPEATSPEDLLVELRRSLETFEPSLVVIDSISSISHSTSTRGFRQFMVGFASLLREHARSALLTQAVNTLEEEEHTAPFLSTIADAIIELDYTRKGKSLLRTISVRKMRGSAHSDDAFRLRIQPGGLQIEPLDDADVAEG